MGQRDALAGAAIIPRLCQARDFLSAHYGERLTLARGAREAGLSPFYFHRAFSRVFRETPHEFVTRLRLERAKQLLLADELSVTEVCFAVGYESLGSFSTRFCALTGLSPAFFRREARRVFRVSDWLHYYIPSCFQSYFLESKNREASTGRGL